MTFGGLVDSVLPAYEIPGDDLIGQVLIPALGVADEVRVGAGFFSSRCLAQVAAGLASFVNNSESPLDLMVSPDLTAEDRQAIRRGVQDPGGVIDDALSRLFEKAHVSGSAIQRYTVYTLAYLVACRRLRIRVVLMERGTYHKKIWLVRAGKEWLAVHGSGNATERGLLINGEQMSIDRAWLDGKRAQERIQIFLRQWDRQWQNRHPSSLTVEVSHALEILRGYNAAEPPTVGDFWQAWRRDHAAGLEPELPPAMRYAPVDHRLVIPSRLQWRGGRYAHQGKAVDALLEHGSGIVAIATGGGKTMTALITAAKLQESVHKHLCVVVVVPSRPLVRQWTDAIGSFGISPVILTGSRSVRHRALELERVALAFATHQPRTEVLVMTNALFVKVDTLERRWLTKLAESVEVVVVADEVHNLGTPSFITNPPEFFTRRIGLSATPIRQYDPDGTHRLFGYFGGPPVFEFSLRDAIDSGCLVPYAYHLHVVELRVDEMDHYNYLTQELVRAGFRIDDDGVTVSLTPRVERLLRERRGLVEQADAKLPALEAQLRRIGTDTVTRTLIYTSAKPTVLDKEKQITAVNGLLHRLNIIAHQYTSHETGTSRGRSIFDRFGAGDYQVLTAMKVLDEGLDIPQTDTAFLLASSTVQREWVQRRGRILRQAPNKQMAHLHDFLVVPPDINTSGGQSLLRSELRRAVEFADLAENEFDPDGPNAVIQDLEGMVWKDGTDA